MLIEEKLLTDKYYIDRLSLFLKNSYGIEERLGFLSKLLNKIDEIYEEIATTLNINTISSKEALDRLGAMFNCSRYITMKYSSSAVSTIELLSAPMVQVELSDSEFLLYIKCQIIKNNFQGTREELLKLYGGEYGPTEFLGINLYYITNEIYPGNCNIYWTNNNVDTDPNNRLGCMFLQGYLTIESLGIQYDYLINDLGNTESEFGIAIFNSPLYSFGTEVEV